MEELSKKIHHEDEDILLSLKGAFIGIVFIVNSFLLEWLRGDKDDSLLVGFEDASLLSGLLGAFILAIPIVIRAIKGILAGEHHMNELVAIAVLACFTLDEYRTAGIVAFLMILSDLVEHKTALGARAAIEKLLHLTPDKAILKKGSSETEVLVTELKIGDTVLVKPGAKIAADGIIKKGNSAIDEANITGESLPVDKDHKDHVYAGTLNLTGLLEVEVTSIGDETTLGKVKHLILDAEKTRLPIMAVIDRYVGWYTPSVLIIATLVFFVTKSLEAAITILILSCPTAVILATPTAMVAALSAASRLGILIKDIKEFERAAGITSVVFDKTGTLTTGNLAVTKLVPVENFDATKLLQFSASIEKSSSHPIAKAIVSIAKEAEIDFLELESVTEAPGKGLSATFEGKEIFVGRQSWLVEKGISCDLKTQDGMSLLHIAYDGQEIGWIGLEDKPRQEALDAVKRLRDMGIQKICMFTGDKKSVASNVATHLGCDEMLAECLPEEKLAYVKKLKDEKHSVAVIGDGVNDAAALAAGDLGVAMAAGSDVAIGSASVAMLTEDLKRLPFLLSLSKQTRSIVYQNLIFGGLFIFIVGALAVAGTVNPVLGGFLQLMSSFVVIFNSFRIVRAGEEFAPHTQTEAVPEAV